MSQEAVKQDIALLTERIVTPREDLHLLRSSLEAALFRLGHSPEDVDAALAKFFERTLH